MGNFISRICHQPNLFCLQHPHHDRGCRASDDQGLHQTAAQHNAPWDQSEPIIIMISHIMINKLYHMVSITDNRPKILSYHLEIWYLDSENYHIISKMIFLCSKLSLHIESDIEISKLKNLLIRTKLQNSLKYWCFKALFLIKRTQYRRYYKSKEIIISYHWWYIFLQKYHIVSLMINTFWKISYHIMDDIFHMGNYHIVYDKIMLNIFILVWCFINVFMDVMTMTSSLK